MPVEFKNKQIVIDGEAKFRFGGEVQHYRMPAGIWRDRLEKVAALGIDMVGCYFGWNFHSPAPGVYDFTSPDRDVAKFLDELERAGLRLNARPGPFLCNELDLGGFPAWLLGRDKNWRIGEAGHLRNCAEWYRAIDSVLAPRQWPAGPVAMYQIENEHFHGDRALYEGLRDAARSDGITVPLVSNGGGSVYRAGATEITDAMDMYTNLHDSWRWRGWFSMLYRLLPPEAPMMILEFRAGHHPGWGTPIMDEFRFPSEWMLSMTRMMIALGANFVNPFVICGGPSPVTLNADHTSTNYGEDAPVNHWGGLTVRFYGYRLLVAGGNAVAAELGESRPAYTESWGTDNARVEALFRRGPRGMFLFPINNSADAETVMLTFDGRTLGPVTLRPRSSQMLVADLPLPGGHRLDFSSFELMRLRRLDNGAELIVHAPAGTAGHLSIDGQRLDFVAAPDVQQFFPVPGVTVFVIDRTTAERTWILPDGRALFSNLALLRPDGVSGEIEADRPFRYTILENGNLLNRVREFPEPPTAGFEISEPDFSAGLDRWLTDGTGFTAAVPWAANAVGDPDEYVWRNEFEVSGPLPETLEFPAVVSSETTFFLNGERLGVFPARRGPGFFDFSDYRMAFDVRGKIRAGRNELAVSCNVYGRHNHGRPIYAGLRVAPGLGTPRTLELPHWSETLDDTRMFHFTELEKAPPELDGIGWTRELDLSRVNSWPDDNLETGWCRARHYRTTAALPPEFRNGPLLLDFGPTNWGVLYVNGRYAGEFGSDNGGVIAVGDPAGAAELHLQVVLVNYMMGKTTHLDRIPKLLRYDRLLTGGWTAAKIGDVRPWCARTAQAPAARQLKIGYDVTVRLPGAEFAYPVYVELDDNWRRHAVLFWNGRPFARYADVGPDRRFHLPEDWIRPGSNRLEIELDGYAADAVPGKLRFGFYERKRKIELRSL